MILPTAACLSDVDHDLQAIALFRSCSFFFWLVLLVGFAGGFEEAVLSDPKKKKTHISVGIVSVCVPKRVE
jgi:hypothetical protein